jgi:hypothetical protein
LALATWLLPGPQLEQISNSLNVQTSQEMPQAPVGMIRVLSFESWVLRKNK